MGGIKALRKIQLGQEATAGTPVAATAIWRGTGTIQDTRETTFVEEDVGYISGLDRTHVARLGGSLSMESTPATFQQLPYLLSASIDGVVTGVADGAGSDYIYTYTASTTAKNTLKTYTIEGGDDQTAEEFDYCFVPSFTLEGNGGEALMMSAEWEGREVTVSTFTGALSVPAVEDILFGNGALYIDAVGGTIGSTQVSNTVMSATLDVTSGYHSKFQIDSKEFTFIDQAPPEVLLTITYEHDANAATEKAAWRAETPRQIRLQWTGTAFGTPGTAYSSHTLRVDLAGKYESFDAITDQDGNDIVTATFRARYNSTAALFFEMVVANELSALT